MPARSQSTLAYDALSIEGGLFNAEWLARVAHLDAPQQKPEDYHIPDGLSLRDEIARAWRIAEAQWGRLKPTLETEGGGRAATHKFVTGLLTQALGFDDLPGLEQPRTLNDRAYPITAALNHIPVVIAARSEGLDEGQQRYGESGRRRSPFGLLQEYLNADDDALWGIVSNGLKLRLLRDNVSLTRPAWLEADLQRIFEEDRFADFSALWLTLHVSRFGAPGNRPEECPLETWRSAGQQAGTRAREELRNGFTEALQGLGQGFLNVPENQALRDALTSGEVTALDYFQQLLRLVYRLIFLLTVEERELLHPAESDENARDLYARGYGLRRLRERAVRHSAHDQHQDLYASLKISFRGLAEGETRLALPPLGGLFATEQTPLLDAANLRNRDLLRAIWHLAWIARDGATERVNWRDMGPEELGSVYESLLELVPKVVDSAQQFRFADTDQSRGNERKTSGSYYTPDSLVQELLDSALEPVIAKRRSEQPDDEAAALLSISVIDPAVGSGHFLLAAARRLAAHLARIRADGQPGAEEHRQAMRDVVTHCLYGVDRNPMALELARISLWLEAFTPSAPLTFIDHHLVLGDALVGLTDFEPLRQGIPAAAFKALTGDDKDVCKALSQKNRTEQKSWQKAQQQKNLDLHGIEAQEALEWLDAGDNASLEEIADKSNRWEALQAEQADSPLRRAADLYMTAFLSPRTGEEPVPTTGDMARALLGDETADNMLAHTRQVCGEARVLHWPLAFAQVTAQGGFDVILGNPPWDVSQLKEEEYFAASAPEIAELRGDARKKAIQSLQTENPHLWEHYQKDKFAVEARNAFHRDGGRLSLANTGKLNLYALFAESAMRLNSPSGRTGMIVQSGIATDNSTKDFFRHIAESGQLASLFDFENREKLFPIDSRMKFCLLTMGQSDTSSFSFFLTNTSQLSDERRSFTLTPEDFARLNPNTRTCPVFRSRTDAELAAKLYTNAPVLWQEEIKNSDGEVVQPEINPWLLRFRQGLFNMTSDSHLFLDSASNDRYRLYEAKYIHQFDHRWASCTNSGGEDASDCTDTQKADPNFLVTPRRWVDQRRVLAELANLPKELCKAYVEQPDLLPRLTTLWLTGNALNDGELLESAARTARETAAWLPEFDITENDRTLALKLASQVPVTVTHRELLAAAPDAQTSLDNLCDQTSPRWLMGWRDITNATNERTVIASVVPRTAVGHTMPLFYSGSPVVHRLLLLGNLNSLILDYIARLKVGGTHLTYNYLKQFPVLVPEAFNLQDVEFITPRILELCYTATDLDPLYQDVVAEMPEADLRPTAEQSRPFAWNPERRALLRAELDAYYARLYGLTRDELRYVLDPADVMGDDYPTETFRVLKEKEMREHGEYRTRRLVLEAWDRLAE